VLVKERPHVVIADVGMPEQDGHTFMGNVRALPADAGGMTPALALTAFAGAEDRAKALRAGFQMHVAKPVDPVELATVVRDLAAADVAPPRL
jgi:CheY-like chemotaxis protein